MLRTGSGLLSVFFFSCYHYPFSFLPGIVLRPFRECLPRLPCGGLSLNDSSAWDGNYPDTLATSNGFAGLTCNYGNPLSGNTVMMKIDCYKDAGIAQKWYQYYRRRSLTRSRRRGRVRKSIRRAYPGHRVGVQVYWGTGPKPAYTFKSAYSDWDYAVSGRYEAEIESTTPTDTITQKEASAKNVEPDQTVHLVLCLLQSRARRPRSSR